MNLLDDGIDRCPGISELRRRRTRPDHPLIRRYGPIAKRISAATLASGSSLSRSISLDLFSSLHARLSRFVGRKAIRQCSLRADWCQGIDRYHRPIDSSLRVWSDCIGLSHSIHRILEVPVLDAGHFAVDTAADGIAQFVGELMNFERR